MIEPDPMSTGGGGSAMRNTNGEFSLEAYRQNFETFRSLNTLFWQIPLIAMTLTGGLWFGVSAVKTSSIFQTVLLALAGLGNLGLTLVLHRLRYIMECYLEWLKGAYPEGHVAAKGISLLTRGRMVQLAFSFLMLSAAIFSFVLILSQ